ncbi:ATP synthase protein I [Candidatus Hepatincolaceae symbiont of Richtersius coronifer]
MTEENNKENSLDLRIRTLKKKHSKQDAKSISPNRKAISIALNSSLELICGLIVGGAIGYMLDKLFKTGFIFFIIFVFLGFIAGVVNLYRYTKNL